MKKIKIKIHARIEFELPERELEAFEGMSNEDKKEHFSLMEQSVKQFFKENVDPESKTLKEFVDISMFAEDE